MADSITSRRFTDRSHASLYKKYRPTPHPQIMENVMEFMAEKISMKNVALNFAIDAACGSGQSTEMLSPHFKEVLGIDISKVQIAEANKSNTLENVSYCVADAHHIPVGDNSVDLVTCSQAAHWLDFPAFCSEVDRVLKPNGCMAAFIFKPERILHEDNAISEKLTMLWQNLIYEDLRPYWGDQNVSFLLHQLKKYDIPYPQFQRKSFEVYEEILYSTFLGYISSLGMYRELLKKNPGNDLLETFQRKFSQALGADKPPSEITLTLQIGIHMLLGRKPSQ